MITHRVALCLCLFTAVAGSGGTTIARVGLQRSDANVVYGMYSGLALLMDVSYPQAPNGFGILTIGGTGWHLPETYAAPGQKDRSYAPDRDALLASGYTVFRINHRAAPRFRYPAALEDAQRAVRFIRSNAQRFGIDAERIGGWGFSSGAHLVGLLGVLDGAGVLDDPDPVHRQSAKLQCVVAGALPSDLAAGLTAVGSAAVASFLGNVPFDVGGLALARSASPLRHVSSDDAAFLLEHGDADELIPFEQAVAMEAALRAAGVPVRLRRVPGGDHGGPRFAAQDPQERYAAILGWFDQYLRRAQ